MRRFPYVLALLSLSALADEPLDEVVVTASLSRLPLMELPGSVTVLDARRFAESSIDHLQDVLPLVPNLNWATGTSRPRYFQLRGVGETEQWQGAPNSSVGFLIDDIDFSGVGMPAGSFDLGQVEVLRGPQGTSYGANALAGLIALRGREPGAQFESALELTAGDFAERSLAALVSGPLGSPDLLGRLSVQRHRSDGFRRNLTLQRDDTNSYDETFVRGKLHYTPGEHTRVRLAGLWAELDNGYDAFALDNSRITRSDKPGRDAQRSLGGSLVVEHDFAAGRVLRSATAVGDSDISYSFDGG
jgi:outer membrane receptor protein involved in Fe transport